VRNANSCVARRRSQSILRHSATGFQALLHAPVHGGDQRFRRRIPLRHAGDPSIEVCKGVRLLLRPFSASARPSSTHSACGSAKRAYCFRRRPGQGRPSLAGPILGLASGPSALRTLQCGALGAPHCKISKHIHTDFYCVAFLDWGWPRPETRAGSLKFYLKNVYTFSKTKTFPTKCKLQTLAKHSETCRNENQASR